jgi:myo-inositol-1-phosphate synthase
VPLTVELELEVHDSPNSAGVIIDAVRCAKLAQDRGIGGPVDPACSTS